MFQAFRDCNLIWSFVGFRLVLEDFFFKKKEYGAHARDKEGLGVLGTHIETVNSYDHL